MIVNIELYIISINRIFVNAHISTFNDNIIVLYVYINISYIAVAAITISITVILLSLEKTLSKYPPLNPIIPSITAVWPIILLPNKSNPNPNMIPNID